MQIIVKRKIYFQEGTIEAPIDPRCQEYVAWQTKNRLIISWICVSQWPKILQAPCTHIQPTIQEDVKDRFQMRNQSHIYQIQQDLDYCYQGFDTVANYHTRLSALEQEVDSYGEIIRCTCNKCTCILSQRLQEKEDRDKVTQFLLGLSDNLSNIISHVLAMDPLLKLNKALSLVNHEERQQNNTSRGSSPSIQGFNAKRTDS